LLVTYSKVPSCNEYYAVLYTRRQNASIQVDYDGVRANTIIARMRG